MLKLLMLSQSELGEWETDPETFVQLDEDSGAENYM